MNLEVILEGVIIALGSLILYRVWDLSEWKGGVNARLDNQDDKWTANEKDHERYENYLRRR